MEEVTDLNFDGEHQRKGEWLHGSVIRPLATKPDHLNLIPSTKKRTTSHSLSSDLRMCETA